MGPSQNSATFHIVCSDRPRNGKTLFARLLIDYLILSGRAPRVFDASVQRGGVATFFPIRAAKIDLSNTAGQIALLDRALEEPLRDCVVDLPAHLFAKLFALLHDFDFAEAAHAKNLKLIIHFAVDRGESSLLAALKLRADNRNFDRFIIVRNDAVAPLLLDSVGKARYESLAKNGRVVIPALDAKAVTAIEASSFSFSQFAEESAPTMPPEVAKSITTLLTFVYRQFDLLDIETSARRASNADKPDTGLANSDNSRAGTRSGS